MSHRHQVCLRCKSKRLYNEKHDAYYCGFCDVWHEPQCSDSACDYCVDRPVKPSMVPGKTSEFSKFASQLAQDLAKETKK